MARKQTGRVNGVDRYVGGRIRERRIMLGLTQHDLADRVGITYQQEHKYERAINRVAAGRLYQIAHVLQVPVDYFFQGIEAPARQPNARERMTLEMVRAMTQISDPRLQEALGNLARSLAASAENDRDETPGADAA